MQSATARPDGALPIQTDAVVVGAGPVGLFQVFELGLHEIATHVVDSLPYAGGQCIQLYADKPIYDIPAMPVCSGRELIDRLQRQIAPFDTPFHLGQLVDTVAQRDDGRFDLRTSRGTRFTAKVVVIAGGIGAFEPRRLKIDGLAAHEHGQLFYGVPEPAALAGRRLVIVGDGDAALDCALQCAAPGPQQAASVTLMHRRDEFKAVPETIRRLRQARDAGTLQFVAAQPVGIAQADGRLTGLDVTTADGSMRSLPLDMLLVLTGLSPRLGPIAEWGLALERRQLVVDPATFATSTPGIFAVGDVNAYAGKKKLIVCGFHEATLAAFAVAAHVFPERAVPLEYTTTSPRLQRLLGVAPVVHDSDAAA